MCAAFQVCFVRCDAKRQTHDRVRGKQLCERLLMLLQPREIVAVDHEDQSTKPFAAHGLEVVTWSHELEANALEQVKRSTVPSDAFRTRSFAHCCSECCLARALEAEDKHAWSFFPRKLGAHEVTQVRQNWGKIQASRG
eukprot:Amastigsp_a340678_15.p2 type:complete len:139 gc:universal Amastigsp_a340678_15:438-22(-)